MILRVRPHPAKRSDSLGCRSAGPDMGMHGELGDSWRGPGKTQERRGLESQGADACLFWVLSCPYWGAAFFSFSPSCHGAPIPHSSTVTTLPRSSALLRPCSRLCEVTGLWAEAQRWVDAGPQPCCLGQQGTETLCVGQQDLGPSPDPFPGPPVLVLLSLLSLMVSLLPGPPGGPGE